MGLFNKMRNLAGSVPKELLENGLLGRGIIVSIQQTSVSTGVDFDPSHVCVFTVEVALDNVPRYTATCRQAVRATVLPQLMMPGATVAVRVDPNEHSRIALSLGGGTADGDDGELGRPEHGSAPRILEHGVPCKAVIVQSQPMGMRNRRGNDMYAFVLTVHGRGDAALPDPGRQSGPGDALPLMYPGNTLPRSGCRAATTTRSSSIGTPRWHRPSPQALSGRRDNLPAARAPATGNTHHEPRE